MLWALAGCHNARAPAPSDQSGGETAVLVERIAALTGGGVSHHEVLNWSLRIDHSNDWGEFLDARLSSEAFSRSLMPALIFGLYFSAANYYAVPSGFILQVQASAGGPIYYLREPCKPEEAEEVTPWWALKGKVRICPDSYRPDQWVVAPNTGTYHSKMPISCDSQVGSPENETASICGCGPYLIRCLPSRELYDAFNRSMRNEVAQTTAYVVENDLPLETLFTGRETFRDRNVELIYRRQLIGSTRNPDVPKVLEGIEAWPVKGRWAPRPELIEGQHAGLLTAPQLLHWLPDRRQRQRGFFEILWCRGKNNFGATTEKVIEINKTPNLAFVHDSWKRLAHTEICENCHARLDYGFQFFFGYPDSRASIHYDPELQLPGEGPFYGNDSHDLRGQGRLTPAGFAAIALAQPEFIGCAADKIAGHVFASSANSKDHALVTAELSKTHNLRATFRRALERMIEESSERRPALPNPPASEGLADLDVRPNIAVSPALRTQLDDWCVDCHYEVTYKDGDAWGVPYDLRSNDLPRSLLVRALDHVAFGHMPKEGDMSRDQRKALVQLFVDNLWGTGKARQEALDYYLTDLQLPMAQSIDSIMSTIRTASDEPPLEWGLLERGLSVEQTAFTPGVAATSALEAAHACGARPADEVEACIEDVLRLPNLVRTALPH